MGDEQQRRTLPGAHREHDVDHDPAGGVVEVAGRLVGQHQLRRRRERARHGDPLLLAAGKLRRVVGEAAGQADVVEPGARDLERVDAARELERDGHVLQRRHRRDEVERLEHDADMAAAEQCQLVLAHRRQLVAGDLDAAVRGPLDPGQNRHHRRLARSRGSDQADRLAGLQRQAGAPQDVDGAGRAFQSQADVFRLHDGRR